MPAGLDLRRAQVQACLLGFRIRGGVMFVVGMAGGFDVARRRSAIVVLTVGMGRVVEVTAASLFAAHPGVGADA